MRENHLENVLTQAIGPEQAQVAIKAIVDEWGGTFEYIPSRKCKEKGDRDKEIRHLHYQKGIGLNVLAERFGVSVRTIRRALGC